MSESKKRSATISKRKKSKPLEAAFLAQSKVLADVMKRQQDLIELQQNTLDRIVTAKYDRPIGLTPQPVPSDAMPAWAMNDQGDVRPDELEAGIQAITAEADSDFLKAVGAQ